MSAEHSVEEVRELSKYLADGTPNWFRESFGDYKSSVHTLDNAPKNAVAMLTAYAERIEADEGAMVVAHRFLAPDGTAVTEWDDGMPDHGKAFPDLCHAIGSVQYAYDHPPAQAAQVDALRWLAVSCDPYKLTGAFAVDHARRAFGMCPFKDDPSYAAAKPVAQGEVVFTGLHIDGSPRYERATNPHSPDAADSGRMDAPRFFIDHTMIHDSVTGKHVTCDPDFRDYVINPGETTRINNPDGISNTCALLNSLAALAAQGQGEAVGEVFGPKAVSTMVALVKPLPPGTKLYTAPPASPAGVPDAVAEVIRECWKVAHLFHSGEGMLTHVKHALDDAYTAPSATPEGGEVGL